MSNSEEFLEAISDYPGVEGDEQFVPVKKGEVVRVIKKELSWYMVEKDTEIGKVPIEYLKIYTPKSLNHQNSLLNQSSKILTSVSKLYTLEQLKTIKNDLFSLKNTKQASTDIINKLTNALEAVYSVESGDQSNITEEMKKITKNLANNVTKITFEIINEEKDVELAIQSGLLDDLIDLVNRTSVEDITNERISAIWKISEKGSAIHSQKMFEIETIQTLTPKLKVNSKNIQLYIIKTIINIIRNGWKQIQQQQIQKSQLQQLLLIPHPYLELFEQQGIIRNIIDDIIMNKEVDNQNKNKVYELLDVLYIEGAKLPSDLQLQIISDLCKQAKSGNQVDQISAFQSLTYLIANKGVNWKEDEDEEVNDNIIKSSLQILTYMFIFGSDQSKKLIRSNLTQETINKLKTTNQYEEEIMILEYCFTVPETLNKLINIRRSVNYKSEQYLIDLIKSGLMKDLNNIIDQDEEKLGEIFLISEIIKLIVLENPSASRSIVETTDFIKNYLRFFTSIEITHIVEYHFIPLSSLSEQLPNQSKKNLFDKGIIQIMIKMLNSEEYWIRDKSLEIINNIIRAGVNELKEGQKHPFHQALKEDGTISKLIQMFKDDKYNIRSDIAQILSCLFKAQPLPDEIKNDIIKILKELIDFDDLALLSESADNHNLLLTNNFEKDLLISESNTLPSLHIIQSILHLGSNANKKKVTTAVKSGVQKLTDDKYADELGKNENWSEDQRKEIKIRAKEIIEFMNANEAQVLKQQKEKEMELQRQKQKEIELQKQKQKEKEIEIQKQKQLEIDKQKQIEQEKLNEQNKQKAKDKENESAKQKMNTKSKATLKPIDKQNEMRNQNEKDNSVDQRKENNINSKVQETPKKNDDRRIDDKQKQKDQVNAPQQQNEIKQENQQKPKQADSNQKTKNEKDIEKEQVKEEQPAGCGCIIL